jgi:hypothetical protein
MTPRYLWQRVDLHQVAMQMIAGLHAWRDYGRKVSGTLLAECLARASAIGVSLTRAAQLLKNGPSDESMRKALHFQGFDLESLRARIGRSLRDSLPRALSRRPVTIAVDYHLRPYYGNVKATPNVRGGKAKQGTRWFWTYASAAIVSRGQRYTVALEPIFHHEQMELVLERLWQQMAQIPLKIKRMLLDREFCAADVILWLQQRRIPFIVPLVRRGRFGRTRKQDQGNAYLFEQPNARTDSRECDLRPAWPPPALRISRRPCKLVVRLDSKDVQNPLWDRDVLSSTGPSLGVNDDSRSLLALVTRCHCAAAAKCLGSVSDGGTRTGTGELQNASPLVGDHLQRNVDRPKS